MAIVDLRGRSQQNLQSLLGGLQALAGGLQQARANDPTFQLRQLLMQNPEVLARAGREFEEGIQSGDIPIDTGERAGSMFSPVTGLTSVGGGGGVGDATDRDVSLPETPGGGLGIDPSIIASLTRAMPETFEEAQDRARRGEGVAGIQARGEAAAGEAQISQSEFQERYFTALNDLDVPEDSAALEDLEKYAGSIQSEQQIEAAEGFAEQWDEMSDIDRFWAGLTIAQPGVANTFLRLQQMDLQERLAGISGGELNPNETMQTRLDLKVTFLDAFRDLREDLDRDDLEPGEIEGIVSRFNSLARDYIYAFPTEPAVYLDIIEKLVGRGAGGIEMRTLLPEEAIPRTAAMMILQEGNDPATVFEQFGIESDQEQQEVMRQVTELRNRRNLGPFEGFLHDLDNWFNSVVNTAGGAGAGAVLGGAAGGPPGAVIGGVLGGVGGTVMDLGILDWLPQNDED